MLFGNRVEDLFAIARYQFFACNENGSGPPSPPHAHLRTEYDNVRVKDIPALRAFINRSSEAFHKRVRAFISKHDLDIKPARAGEKVQGQGRVVVTTFSHTEDNSQAEID